jgi:uncharacterized protein YndB with AHSA1/START domain
MPAPTPAQIARYELEIPIHASPETLWKALTESIDAWWLPDFRTLGPDSKVTFDPRAGGTLTENAPSGQGLVWFTVQMVVPGSAVYLVGHLAPEWGGPTTSMLKLGVEARGTGSVLIVSDSLVGNVSEQSAAAQAEGWQQLFGEGLRSLAEGT